LGNFGTIVFDLDGVLYRSDDAVPGAAAALEQLAASGVAMVYATNNATRLAEDVAAVITRRVGHPVDPDEVVTSSMATAAHLAGRVAAALVVGTDALRTELERAGVGTTVRHQGADAVVVGLDPGLTYDKLKEASLAVAGGARLVATNDDATFPSSEGILPGAGAIVAALERATGITAEVCGKPHPPMLRALAGHVRSGPVLVVGDRIDTDVAMGTAMGWSTALVATGVTPPEVVAAAGADYRLASVADLPAVVGIG
jgi:HAD superfamily hydrolase (TIGR01450 family)